MENQPTEQNKLQALQPASIPFLFEIYRELNQEKQSKSGILRVGWQMPAWSTQQAPGQPGL